MGPLWDDLRAVAERVLAADGRPIASHFLGTVVLEQARNLTGSLPRREIIDGQQRLTTLQIALKAVEHALESTKADVVGDEKAERAIDIARRQIAPLTENPAYAEPDERYKVWPTNEDRAPFRAVMDSTPSVGLGLPAVRMAEAYRYFRVECQAWLGRDKRAERAAALASALKDYLKLIVLDLDPEDEPQAIFETLNAHGTPLLPADLIKNWLLWEATRQKLNVQALYEAFWRPFDRDFMHWREKIGTGHAARPRIDTFLQNWLSCRTHRAVAPKHLYNQFLDYVQDQAALSPGALPDVQKIMSGIAKDAERFRYIEQPVGNARFDTFLRRLKTLDIVVFYPLLLAVLGREGSDQKDRDDMAVALESFLVRRMVCNEQTRGYGTLVLALLEKLARAPEGREAAPTLIEALAAHDAAANAWPSDSRLQDDWSSRRFYGYYRRDRVLMILRAIEERLQRDHVKSEPILSFDYSKLEIEHLMPQEWEEHWPLDATVASRDERNWLVQTIGNLTLVGAKLNKSMSNGPWTAAQGAPCKTAGLDEHSKLELNAAVLGKYPDAWNENAIRQRTRDLFEVGRRVWPSAGELKAKITREAEATDAPPSNFTTA